MQVFKSAISTTVDVFLIACLAGSSLSSSEHKQTINRGEWQTPSSYVTFAIVMGHYGQ